MLRLAVLSGVLGPYLLGHAESCPRLGPAGVKGCVGQDLSDLLPCDAVLPGGGKMVLEGAVHQTLGHQSHYCHQGAVTQREFVLPAPYLAEQYIVIELGKFGGKLPQSISARCLFYCHIEYLLCKRKCYLYRTIAKLCL